MLAWEHIGHAIDVVAMAFGKGDGMEKLFCATRDNKLWWRDPIRQNVNWEHIGHANNVVAMTFGKGDGMEKLFCITRDERGQFLNWRDPVGHDVDWEHIGPGPIPPNKVVAMTFGNREGDGMEKLFCITRDERGVQFLNWRDPVKSHNVGWEHIGPGPIPPNKVVAMTFGKWAVAKHKESLFCITVVLPGVCTVRWRDPVKSHNVGWGYFGNAPNNVAAMTHGKGEGREKLFSISLPPQNKLFWVNPSLGQENWRWCSSCQILRFGGNSQKDLCPANGYADHSHSLSGNYILINNDTYAPGQHHWYWCKNCQGLFFAGRTGGKRFCPAGFGTRRDHDGSASGNYKLVNNDPYAPNQDNWRWCKKCSGLFFAHHGKGVCPAQGEHDDSASRNYTLVWT